jgi:hypothetical protein
MVAWFLAEVGRPAAAAQAAERIPDDLATNPFGTTSRAVFPAWALCCAGDDAGIPALEAALDRTKETSGRLFEALCLLFLARGYATRGDFENALVKAGRALDIAQREIPIHAPEALRLRAESALACAGDLSQTLADLREARDWAERQTNLLHQLRAQTSLVRVMREHGVDGLHAEVDALRVMCEQFPEGDDLPDLESARGALT